MDWENEELCLLTDTKHTQGICGGHVEIYSVNPGGLRFPHWGLCWRLKTVSCLWGLGVVVRDGIRYDLIMHLFSSLVEEKVGSACKLFEWVWFWLNCSRLWCSRQLLFICLCIVILEMSWYLCDLMLLFLLQI